MKRFCITLYPATRPREAMFRHPLTGRDFIIYAFLFAVGNITRPTEEPCPVYWADDEESAKAMATLLTFQKPGMTALVSETKWVYQTNIPGDDFPTTVSKLSAKGLLPE